MTLFSEIADYSMTIVRAGAGYGKTTAMNNYAETTGLAVFWLTLTEEDRDPSQFIVSFMTAFMPDSIDKKELEDIIDAVTHSFMWESAAERCADLVNLYLFDESVFVFDDFHVLDDELEIIKWIDQWLRQLTGNLHIVFLTRTEPTLAALREFRLRGDVLSIRERDLVFTEDEIAFMFETGAENWLTRLPYEQVHWLRERTGGMAIVLYMIWRDWRMHHSFERLQSALEQGHDVSEQIGQLFLSGIPSHLHLFFRYTAILDELEGGICDYLVGNSDSAEILRFSEQKGYITHSENGLSYFLHPLVRDYLESTLTESLRDAMLWKAIAWHDGQGNVSLSVRYLFALIDERVIARELLRYIPSEMEKGHVLTVRGWLDRLQKETLLADAGLLYKKAEVSRLTNQFSDALIWYEAAFQKAMETDDRKLAIGALIGRARFYLDTIQPAMAETFIWQAKRLTRREDVELRRDLLELRYENSINSGRLIRAERLYKAIHGWRSFDYGLDNVDGRLFLRKGDWEKALSILQTRVEKEKEVVRAAHFHREATLIISLIESLMGESKEAEIQALRGYHLGDFLQAPFVRAVGYIRLGHAKHLQDPLGNEALNSYQTAIKLMEEMDVTRGKAEAYMGLCLSYGYQGQYMVASTYAEQGIAIASQAGDTWMTNLIRLAYVQVDCINHAFGHAIEQSAKCSEEFERCGDRRLLIFSYLWSAVARFFVADPSFKEDLRTVFALSEEQRYEDFWYQPTFFGWRDVHQAVPVLRELLEHEVWQGQVRIILERLHSGAISDHPGYTLRVKTLGSFRVWRGFTEIARKEWQREKARQLFQILLSHRGTPLFREQITDQLWGDVPPEIAERDFKVALNALATALNPNRIGRGSAPFIEKNNAAYQLTMNGILVVDRDEFTDLVKKSEKSIDDHEKCALLRTALSLYEGDYLPEARYELWSENERERLRTIYMRSVEIYANLCFDQHQYQEVLDQCVKALEIDPTWETMYVIMMKCYSSLSNRSMVVQTYQTCKRVLERELGIEVSENTSFIYHSLVSSK